MRAHLPKCNVPLFHEFEVELLTYTDWAKKRQGDTECDRSDSADFVTTEDPRTEIASQRRHALASIASRCDGNCRGVFAPGGEAFARQAENGAANLGQSAIGNAGGVVVHAKNERRNGVDIAVRQTLQNGSVFAGLVEAFVDVSEVRGIDGLHADEHPFTAGKRRSGPQVPHRARDWR